MSKQELITRYTKARLNKYLALGFGSHYSSVAAAYATADIQREYDRRLYLEGEANALQVLADEVEDAEIGASPAVAA